MNENIEYEAETYEWTRDDNLQIQALQAQSPCRINIALFSRNKENGRKLVRIIKIVPT
jgi:hypothetical protein